MNRNQFVVMAILSFFTLLFGISCVSVPAKSSAKLSGNGGLADDAGAYLLGPDDVIRINVDKHPEWSGDFPVRPDGRILISGLGELTVGGLGADGVELTVFSALGKYINNPQVTVEIVRYASQIIYVLGEVEHPGRFSTEGKAVTLRDAVIMAGLPTRFAADKHVYVITPRPRHPYQQVVNLYRVLYRGETLRNVTLHPGDIVYVPPTILGRIVHFVGNIVSPLASTVPAARTMATPGVVQ